NGLRYAIELNIKLVLTGTSSRVFVGKEFRFDQQVLGRCNVPAPQGEGVHEMIWVPDTLGESFEVIDNDDVFLVAGHAGFLCWISGADRVGRPLEVGGSNVWVLLSGQSGL